MTPPKAFVGVTDGSWFAQLRALDGQRPLDEINFWQPSGTTRFRALTPGEPFLFKLHSPNDFIVGGGFFGHFSLLPVPLAWETFGTLNGVASLDEMWRRIARYRRAEPGTPPWADPRPIGCILLQQPFFFDESDWIAVPDDWASNIVRGKGYDLGSVAGRRLWEAVRERLDARPVVERNASAAAGPSGPRELAGIVGEAGERFGRQQLVQPRLGQGTFRVAVLDAYERRCSVTQERTLPVLDAAHVRPYSAGGEHRVSNGLCLRTDLHRLYDAGYVTVTPELRLEVSRRIREEFENGRDYYALAGQEIRIPKDRRLHPDREALEYHAERLFVA